MEPLILSSSSLKLFKTCRKAYELGYERLLDPVGTTTEAVEDGTEFHTLVEMAAKGVDISDQFSPMAEVAQIYLSEEPLPEGILMVEEPFFVKLDEDVFVRCTFDLVYERGSTIVGRDYKTFDKKPQYDMDLDFQGRFYCAALRQKYPDHFIEFEYKNVRRTPPGTVHNQKGDVWRPDECYITNTLIPSNRELDQLWEETQWVAKDIKRAKQENRWYRQDRKGWGGCQSCFYRNLCKTEVQQGSLDEQTIRLLSIPRSPLTLPG